MDNQTLSCEWQLILLCSRLKIDEKKLRVIRSLLNCTIDWNKVVEIGEYHRVLPFLYFNLNRLNLLHFASSDIQQTLKNYYYINLNNNLKIYRESTSLLQAVNQADIKIVVLKGLSLIETIYRNPGLRIMVDIDILAKENDILKLKMIFSQLGYKELEKNYPVKYVRKFQITFAFVKYVSPNLLLYIDLHRSLAPARPFKIDLPQLWQRLKEYSLAGQKTYFLSSEDTLLLLALHLNGHLRQPITLKTICDIAELLNLYADNLDWQYLRAMAIMNHMLNNLYFILYISKSLLDAPVSDELLSSFKLGIFKKKIIQLCLNKHNFLEAKKWQGFILRFLLFDNFIFFLLYLWRVCFLERLIVRGDLRQILPKIIPKPKSNVSPDEIIKK